METRAQRTFRRIGAFARVGAVAGIAGIGIAARKAFQEFEEAEKATKQTDAVLKSTGAVAGVTAKQVEKLAQAISLKTGIDDEAIQSAQNLLLTFTSVRNEVGAGNDIFNQATAVINDMSVALGQDLKSSTIQVGKALQDPIKGITALRRVGVNFNAQQTEQVKKMVESGRQMDAQKFILRELRKEFEGSAEAQATSSEKMKVAIDNVLESLGRTFAPALEKAAQSVAGFLNDVNKVFQRTDLTPGQKWDRLGDMIGAKIDKALPRIAEAVARIGPKVAEVFVRSLLNAPPLIQFLTGAWLLKKAAPMLAAAGLLGRQMGAAYGTGMATGVATTAAGGAGLAGLVGGAAGGAAARRGIRSASGPGKGGQLIYGKDFRYGAPVSQLGPKSSGIGAAAAGAIAGFGPKLLRYAKIGIGVGVGAAILEGIRQRMATEGGLEKALKEKTSGGVLGIKDFARGMANVVPTLGAALGLGKLVKEKEEGKQLEEVLRRLNSASAERIPILAGQADQLARQLGLTQKQRTELESLFKLKATGDVAGAIGEITEASRTAQDTLPAVVAAQKRVNELREQGKAGTHAYAVAIRTLDAAEATRNEALRTRTAQQTKAHDATKADLSTAIQTFKAHQRLGASEAQLAKDMSQVEQAASRQHAALANVSRATRGLTPIAGAAGTKMGALLKQFKGLEGASKFKKFLITADISSVEKGIKIASKLQELGRGKTVMKVFAESKTPEEALKRLRKLLDGISRKKTIARIEARDEATLFAIRVRRGLERLFANPVKTILDFVVPPKPKGRAMGGLVSESLSLVGEQGFELAKLPTGKMAMLGQQGPEIRALPVGTQVIPHRESKRKLAPLAQKVIQRLVPAAIPQPSPLVQSVVQGPLGTDQGRQSPRPVLSKAAGSLRTPHFVRMARKLGIPGFAKGGIVRELDDWEWDWEDEERIPGTGAPRGFRGHRTPRRRKKPKVIHVPSRRPERRPEFGPTRARVRAQQPQKVIHVRSKDPDRKQRYGPSRERVRAEQPERRRARRRGETGLPAPRLKKKKGGLFDIGFNPAEAIGRGLRAIKPGGTLGPGGPISRFLYGEKQKPGLKGALLKRAQFLQLASVEGRALRLKELRGLSKIRLTRKERAAIQRYVGDDDYLRINKALREGADIDPDLISAMDRAVSKGKRLPRDVALHREVADRTRALGRETESSKVFRNLKVGDEFTDKGYISTATRPEPRERFGSHRYRFKIKAEKGTRVLDIGGSEREVLLQRNSRFKVLRRRTVRNRLGSGSETQITLQLLRAIKKAGGPENFGKPVKASATLTPAARYLASTMKDKFGLSVSSGLRPLDTGSFHSVGKAVDLVGSRMREGAEWVKTSGLYKTLLEGIHNPNLSTDSGKLVSSGFWGAKTWGEHKDHIHLAASSIVQKVKDKVAGVGDSGKKKASRITGGKLSLGQMVTLSKKVGFPDPALAAAVGYAESTGRVGAVGDGGDSLGLFQINTPAHPKYDKDRLQHDALYNARAALAISKGGKTFQPWTQYRNAAYKQFLGGRAAPLPKGTSKGASSGSSFADYLELKQTESLDTLSTADDLKWINRALRYYRGVYRRNKRAGNFARANEAKVKVQDLKTKRTELRDAKEEIAEDAFTLGDLIHIGKPPKALDISWMNRFVFEPLDLRRARAALTTPPDDNPSQAAIAASLQDDIGVAGELKTWWERLHTMTTGFRLPAQYPDRPFNPTSAQQKYINAVPTQAERIERYNQLAEEARLGPWVVGTIKQQIDAATNLASAKSDLKSLTDEAGPTETVEDTSVTGPSLTEQLKSFVTAFGELMKQHGSNIIPKFAKGGTVKRLVPSLVGEEGPELVELAKHFKPSLAVVGQEGPEVVNLPIGSRVRPHPESKRIAEKMGIPGFAQGGIVKMPSFAQGGLVEPPQARVREDGQVVIDPKQLKLLIDELKRSEKERPNVTQHISFQTQPKEMHGFARSALSQTEAAVNA